MSLFDVIRYPIDINFRVEDLDRIPTKLLQSWWYDVVENKSAHFPSGLQQIIEWGEIGTYFISDYLRNTNDALKWRDYALEDLKRRIRNYEPI